MEISRLGESGIIIAAPDSSDVLDLLLSWRESLLDLKLRGLVEIIPSYQTLTVLYNPLELSFENLVRDVERALSVTELPPAILRGNEYHEIPVCYDLELAPDLEELAEFCNMDVAEVISLHSSVTYRVTGIGFSPGFGFLSGLPDALACQRKESPRTGVPEGAVGIAGMQTGIYPSNTSGGWNLIGRTPKRMVDYSSHKPSLLSVGDQVRFVQMSKREFNTYQD